MVKDLTQGRPVSVILRFAIPLLLGFWLQQMYNLVDTAIVGRTLGAMALGGVGSMWSLNYLVLGFCNGVGTGMALPVARAFGARDEKQVRRYVANCIWIGLMVCAGVLLIILPSCRTILTLMQTTPEQFQYAYDYIFTIFSGIPAAMLYNMTAGILRALGDSKTPVKFLAISVALNVGLDLLFVRTFQMGVFGAAFATVLSHLISGLLCLVYMAKHFPILHMERDDWKLRREEAAELLNMGLPMGVQHSIAALSMVIVQRAVNGLGAMAVSSYAAGSKIFTLLTGPYSMLGTASSNFTSQNLGAKQFDRIRQGTFACMLLGCCYWVLHMLIAFFATDYIVLLFLKAEEAAAIIDLVRLHCRIEAVFGIPLLVIFVYRMAVQGLGYGKLSLFGGLAELLGRSSAMARWATVMKVRSDVNGILERARADKRIGKSLEAEVRLFAVDADAAEAIKTVQNMNLPEILIVSSCVIAEGKPEEGKVIGAGEIFKGLTIEVSEAAGVKCPRCWKHAVDAQAETGLCPRCAAVIAAMPE